MNRYTVYLNRPKPNHQVVVYADRYRIEDPLNVVPRLILERDHGDPVVFTDWDAIVPDEPVEEPSGFRDAVGNSFEDSAPGPSQAWWEKQQVAPDDKLEMTWSGDYASKIRQLAWPQAPHWMDLIESEVAKTLEYWPVVGGHCDGSRWVADQAELWSVFDGIYVEDSVTLIDGTRYGFYRHRYLPSRFAVDQLSERFPEEVGEKLQYPSRCIGGELSGAEGWNVLPDGYRAAFITYQDERVRVFVPEEFTDSDILKEILRLGLGV